MLHYCRVGADHVHPFIRLLMATSSIIMHYNVTKQKVASKWSYENDDQFNVLQWPPQSPDLNLVEHFLNEGEQNESVHKNLQKLFDTRNVSDTSRARDIPTEYPYKVLSEYMSMVTWISYLAQFLARVRSVMQNFGYESTK